MSNETDKELEQLQKLDKLRKLVQTILGAHLTLLFLIFLLVLASVLTIVVMSVTYSSRRYLARLNMESGLDVVSLHHRVLDHRSNLLSFWQPPKHRGHSRQWPQ